MICSLVWSSSASPLVSITAGTSGYHTSWSISSTELRSLPRPWILLRRSRVPRPIAGHGGEDFLSEEAELLSPSDGWQIPLVNLVPYIADGRVHHLSDVCRREDGWIYAAKLVEDFGGQVWRTHLVDGTKCCYG